MSDITPVIFRRWPKERVRDKSTGRISWEGGDCIALFPCDPGTCDPHTMSSYEHLGQHGAASTNIIGRTILATPAEYAELKAELEGAPYHYKFRVYRRMNPAFDKARRAALRDHGSNV